MTATSARSLPASALRRWRSLRPRGRLALGLLATSFVLAGLGLAGLWRADPWPARAVLRSPGAAWPLAFSPDGETFTTFGAGGITTWDVATGRRRETWAVEAGHAAVTGAFSPDGKTFAAATFSPTQAMSIVLFDPATGRARATLPANANGVFQIGFTDEGRSVRAFLADNSVLKEVATWDASTGLETSRRPISGPTGKGIAAIAPDGRTLAIGTQGATAVQLRDLDADRSMGGLANLATTSAVSWGGIGFSEDGRILAIGRVDGTIELWDVPARRHWKTLRGHSGDYASSMIKFSPDGRTLASNGHRTGNRSMLTDIHDEIRSLLGANTGEDSEVVVVDTGTGERVTRSEGSIHPFYSPDGRTIATRERDLSIKLRDVPGKAH